MTNTTPRPLGEIAAALPLEWFERGRARIIAGYDTEPNQAQVPIAHTLAQFESLTSELIERSAYLETAITALSGLAARLNGLDQLETLGYGGIALAGERHRPAANAPTPPLLTTDVTDYETGRAIDAVFQQAAAGPFTRCPATHFRYGQCALHVHADGEWHINDKSQKWAQ